MSITQKLIDIQDELKAPKDLYNDFAKFKYRSAESILDAVKPLLKKHGLLITLSDSMELLGNRYYNKTTCRVTDGTNTVEVTASAREEESKKGMDAAQITGAATSYSRKYALGGMFAIEDVQDPDGKDNSKEPEKKTQPSTTPANQEPAKQWLNPGTEDWTKTIAYAKKIELPASEFASKIKAKYAISNANKDKFFTEMGWS